MVRQFVFTHSKAFVSPVSSCCIDCKAQLLAGVVATMVMLLDSTLTDLNCCDICYLSFDFMP